MSCILYIRTVFGRRRQDSLMRGCLAGCQAEPGHLPRVPSRASSHRPKREQDAPATLVRGIHLPMSRQQSSGSILLPSSALGPRQHLSSHSYRKQPEALPARPVWPRTAGPSSRDHVGTWNGTHVAAPKGRISCRAVRNAGQNSPCLGPNLCRPSLSPLLVAPCASWRVGNRFECTSRCRSKCVVSHGRPTNGQVFLIECRSGQSIPYS